MTKAGLVRRCRGMSCRGDSSRSRVPARCGRITVSMLIVLIVLTAEFEGRIQTGNTDERNNTLSFASYYGDHMVLQQAPKRSSIWGFADPQNIGQIVYLNLYKNNSNIQERVAEVLAPVRPTDSPTWQLLLDPVEAGGPYTIVVTLNKTTIGLKDVLFGDVWLCSGQSNMVFNVPMMFNSSEEIAYAAKYPDIRVISASKIESPTPLQDIKAWDEKWSVASEESIGNKKPFTYFSAVCWTYGRHLRQKLGYPIGLIASAWGGTPIEAWSSTEALEECGVTEKNYLTERPMVDVLFDTPQEPSVLWNAMLYPLTKMTIYGAIWYQGEQNAQSTGTRLHMYNCTFPSMIHSWRKTFYERSKSTDPSFPFGFVQLAPNRPHSTSLGFPEVRWHQTADFGYVPNPVQPNVFMSVAIDMTDFHSPYSSDHTRDKGTVSSRLALSGLSVAYGQKIHSHGPFPSLLIMQHDKSSMIVEFDERQTPIHLLANDGFEVCCELPTTDGPSNTVTWIPAFITDHNSFSITLVVHNCTKEVVGLRYLWKESPCSYKKCAVYSVENELPAPPFIFPDIQWTRNIYKITRKQ